MANPVQHCPKCKGGMEQGFVVDNARHARVVSLWVPGAPQTAFWTGLKVSDPDGLPIGAFRCSSCGYLEMYAGEEFAAK